MNGPSHFLFDECIGKPLMLQLRQIVATESEFVHICDYYRQGIKDAEWVPRIAAEGRWVVITSDGGKGSKKGEKLPDLCLAHSLTHVILSSTLHKKNSREKVAVIAPLWSGIESLAFEPAGGRWQLRYRAAKGSNLLRLELRKIESGSPSFDPPPDVSSTDTL
ncbi:MAG: hypothetical protein JNK93_21145 [Planctomycetia bacterium]|nr:hypothetical protein [Planctomycetia bacterium]